MLASQKSCWSRFKVALPINVSEVHEIDRRHLSRLLIECRDLICLKFVLCNRDNARQIRGVDETYRIMLSVIIGARTPCLIEVGEYILGRAWLKTRLKNSKSC